MELRKKIFVIIGMSILVIVIAGLLYWYFSNKPKTTSTTMSGTTKDGVTANVVMPADFGPDGVMLPEIKRTPDEVYAKQVARIFTENFGSYSNQNGNSNIDNVLPMSTDVMRKWLLVQKKPVSGDYAGQTTLVVASRIDKIDASSASVIVDTQQTITNSTGESVTQRSGRVDLLLQDNDWKVDGFYWEK